MFADSTGSFTNLNISGEEWNGTGSGEVVTSGGSSNTVGSKVYYVTQTVAGGTNGTSSGNTTTPFTPQQMNVSGGTQGNRLTWVQRR